MLLVLDDLKLFAFDASAGLLFILLNVDFGIVPLYNLCFAVDCDSYLKIYDLTMMLDFCSRHLL